MLGVVAAAGASTFVYRNIDGTDKDRFDGAVAAATAAAALVAGVLTWGRLELSRNEHNLGVNRDLTERFGRSIEQIGSENPIVRVGGVFALERFALDAAQATKGNDVDWRMALDLLATLARRLAREPHEEGPPAGLIEAVQVIGRFQERSGLMSDSRGRSLPTGVDVQGGNLAGGQFVGANLRPANFRQSNLSSAAFALAELIDADFAKSTLDGASLSGMYAVHACFRGASMVRVTMDNAHLSWADLSGSNLKDATMNHSVLSGARLTGANLQDANLVSAVLKGADLAGANMTGADLTEADLREANLVDATLDGAILVAAVFDESTDWPKGFDVPSVQPATMPWRRRVWSSWEAYLRR